MIYVIASATTPGIYILLRVHKKKLCVPLQRQGQWVGIVGGRGRRERPYGEKLGTIGMLIRFARFLGCFVLFCECRSSADAASWNAFRGRAREGERIKARKITSIFHSRFPERIDAKHSVILLCTLVRFFIRKVRVYQADFYTTRMSIKPIQPEQVLYKLDEEETLSMNLDRFNWLVDFNSVNRHLWIIHRSCIKKLLIYIWLNEINSCDKCILHYKLKSDS